MSENAVFAILNAGKSWSSPSPLRFIERDGEKILQHPWVCRETGEVEWKDVPLEVGHE